MIRLIRRLLAAAIVVMVLGWVGTAAYVHLHAEPDPMPQAAAIIVLSGSDTGDRELTPGTAARVAHGVRLWQAGAAPSLVMTGGTLPDGARTRVAERMRDAAMAAGVPAEAILVEAASHSTLQNAILTADLLPPDTGPVILVSHRFHLPRAWFNFRAQGYGIMGLSAPDTGPALPGPGLLAEGPKWAINLVRAGLHAGLSRAGVNRASYFAWLE